MHQKSYTCISPTYVNYRINGTGRDTYISANNGGYYRVDSMTSKPNPCRNCYIRPVTPTSPAPRSVKYISDGTGRDRISDGGLHAATLPANSQKPFEKSLRSYSRPSSSYSSNDFFSWANKVWQTERSKSTHKMRRSVVKDTVKRLSLTKNRCINTQQY